MKKVLLITLVVAMLFSLSSCIEVVEGVSQEEYDALLEKYNAVVSERDALLNGEPIETATKIDGETADEPETTNAPTLFFNEAEVLSQIEVTEYSYSNEWAHYAFLVIKNNSEYTLNISAAVKFFNESGELIGAKNGNERPVGSDTEVCMYFMPDEKFATMEYELSVERDKSYESIVSDLSYEATSAKNKEIVSVTNNGSEAADFAKVHALFFNGDQVVEYSYKYVVDNDDELKPGKTISAELNCYEEYTSVRFFFTGRKRK